MAGALLRYTSMLSLVGEVIHSKQTGVAARYWKSGLFLYMRHFYFFKREIPNFGRKILQPVKFVRYKIYRQRTKTVSQPFVLSLYPKSLWLFPCWFYTMCVAQKKEHSSDGKRSAVDTQHKG